MFKIAYLLTPIDFGGAEKVSLNFLKHVNREKFNIDLMLFLRPWEGKNFFHKEIENYNYQFFRIPVALRPLERGRDRLRIIRCYKKISCLLKSQRYDLIHTNGYFADIISIPLSKLFKIPILSTCHGFISLDKKLSFYNSLDCYLLRFSNRIAAVSKEIKKDLIKTGVPGSKIKVIHNAVETIASTGELIKIRRRKRMLLGIERNELVIGYVGRLSREKGIRYLIEAASILRDRGLPIKVIVIGDGPIENQLKTIVSEINIEKQFIFAGFQKKIMEWIPAIDIFILPSLTEGTPMALLEVMSMGVPVVASAVGGIPDIINSGENGILVGKGKPEEIANAVINLYKNEELRLKIKDAAMEHIKTNFNFRKWVSEVESLYEELIFKNNCL